MMMLLYCETDKSAWFFSINLKTGAKDIVMQFNSLLIDCNIGSDFDYDADYRWFMFYFF